jgi:hypothetical protein
MAYHLQTNGVNSTPSLSGRYLAHNRIDLIARAFIAADLVSGAKCLVVPTLKQAAQIGGADRTYRWRSRCPSSRFLPARVVQ